MDCFTKWLEAYTIPDQEALTVVEALITNFFYCFGIPWELHRDQSRDFESRLLQEVLQRLGVSKMCTTPMYTQSDAMMEHYIKTVEEHL
jgi:Mn-dependent DtxR family transcriptional regulator